MSAFKLIPNYTYEDYLRWPGNWEVIDGLAYSMSPMPNPRHQSLATEMTVLLKSRMSKNKCTCKVYQPIDVMIEANTIVCPDVLIVCKPIDKQYLDFPPELVVEIFSPTTRLKDQYTKYELYQNFGIKYYVMVDPDTEAIMIHHLVNGSYQLIDSDDTYLEIVEGCKIPSNMSEIFLEA
jgi:Uma2 family endonuclease